MGWRVPDAIDPILFLLALLLTAGSLRQLVGIVGGFTVGHTITFALAALGVVHVPASVIQPLIALTIGAAAVLAFTGKLEGHRWKIATGFGLVHGFGYANALHLSHGAKALLGYYLGIEIGQLVIVLVLAPLVLLLHRTARVGRPVIREAAIAIFSVAMYLFISRL